MKQHIKWMVLLLAAAVLSGCAPVQEAPAAMQEPAEPPAPVYDRLTIYSALPEEEIPVYSRISGAR